MREIKFRGKRNDIGWKYGYLTCIENKTIGSWEQKPAIRPFDELFITYGVDPETVGEYTGLKDKKGVEVYEGDILFASLNNGKYEVKFGLYACEHNDTDDRIPSDMGFYIERFNDKYHNRTDSQEGMGESSKYLEIIGNIYENPELLNEEKT